MHSQWFDKKSNNYFNAPNTRSLTPKMNPSWRDDTERTPERIKTEYSQQLSFSPSPTFHQKKNSSIINPTTKALNKISEINSSTEKFKVQKQTKSPNPLSKTYIHQSPNHQLKNKLINSNSSISNSQIQTNTSTEITNNENNYLNQITIMMQKIVKYKQDIETYKERENQFLTKIAMMEKENKALYSNIEELEKRMQDVQKKAKEDKVKMYQFLTEIEAYKEANAELQKNKEKDVGSQNQIDQTESRIKVNLINKCIQTLDENNSSCYKCDIANNQSQLLIEKLAEIEESSKQMIEDYSQLKASFDQTKKQEYNLHSIKNDMESKYKEMQREISKQNLLCSTILAENNALKNTITLIAQDDDSSHFIVRKTNKEGSQTNKINFMPSSFKALASSEKISMRVQNLLKNQDQAKD